jgi:hypothetical protein
MANKNLITNGFTLQQIIQNYYAPVATVPTTGDTINIYSFLSKVLPWPNDNDPEQPRQDQKYLKDVFQNMFVAKKLTSNDISPVIERIDWVSGLIYDYYRDDQDMFKLDDNGFLVKQFYIINRYDQIFKCLWNNNNGKSTVEPMFQPGTYGTNGVYFGNDGYKWKFMLSVSTLSKFKFMDREWIPIPVSFNTVPNPIQSTAGYGSIDVINVVNGGTGYDSGNSSIVVTILGDGSGAAATAETSGGKINEIYITTPGSNYTYANAFVTGTTANGSTLGSGSSFIVPVSPIGGHGFNPISELGCQHVMFTIEFNAKETVDGVNYIPTDIDFRQVGLLMNPTSVSSYPNFATGNIYNITTQITVSSGFGVYIADEEVYQYTSLVNGLPVKTFTATVLSFNPVTNVLQLINTKGQYVTSTQLYSDTSGTTRTLLYANTPDFHRFSGYITYLENRSAVTRSVDGIEQFKFVLGF